ncbi:type VI secretion system Hcp family effector [Neolewinella xylanilytica]|uniref:Type VI secretion system Hcp family effector n=1 Tax=Neolewinella xylanilytica TaxID=1514080 RepID=A0A2S6I849_9BACT|nr:type VI secretion system tube protein Hcp [Neolewinella xylanilytica]PPK87670.1 type VI secretion system Hcp family effector [Neolewinella xylanilytica]
MITTRFRPLLLGLLVFALPNLLSAQLAYALEIEDIAGELSAVGYEDQIKICSFSYGISSDAGSGRVSPSVTQGAFLLGKSTDRATPFLFAAVARIRRFDEVTLTAYREGAGNQVIMIFEFTNVVFTKFETGAEGSEGIDEVIGLLAEEVEITYRYYGNDGALAGTYVERFNFADGI